MDWEQPHWSGRPQQLGEPRQRLRPNGFAKMARFAAANRHVLVGIYLLLAAVCGGFATVFLEIDPDTGPRITLDEKTAAAQAALEQEFPGVDQTLLAIVESRDGETARAQAVALAASLSQRNDLFSSAFVPGTGDFYEANALLYHSVDDVRARVDAVLQMQPLYQAVAAAPDILGLTALVAEIGKVVEQGRSPAGLEALLVAVSATIESEVRGSIRPIQWADLAGIGGETRTPVWFMLATPRPGLERNAANFARQASDGMQGVSWLWPRRALGSTASPMRDFVVPAGLSIFVTMTLLGAGLGSFRLALATILPGVVTLAVSAAAAAAMGHSLDGATWSFAAAVLAPVIFSGVVLAIAYSGARSEGASVRHAAMLAAQMRGGLVSGVTLLFCAFWLSWLVRQLPSLSQFAVIALIGAAIAWLAAMTLFPAAIALFDRTEANIDPHWFDEALEDQRSYHVRNALDVAAMIILAVAVFSAAFLPGVRFGERQLPSTPGPMLETPDARGAVHVLARPDQAEKIVAGLAALSDEGTVGAIRTVSQFMPPDAAAKIVELRRLEGVTPFVPKPRPPAEQEVLRDSFTQLETGLTEISMGPATSPDLRDAALRLRRAVNLFITPEPPREARVLALEEALFSGLGELSRKADRLSKLAVPAIRDLDPMLLRRFVAEDGTWRIEVMPKSGIGLLSFAASVRRAVPSAAGEPIAALARNEIIHHETLLALGAAFAAAAILVLAVLRSPVGWAMSLLPVGAFVTLTSATVVLLDVGLNAAMLAGASAVAALLIACSMVLAEYLTKASTERIVHASAMRAALVPPLVLAGAVAPLAISSRPAVAELGAVMALMLFTAAVLCLVLIPALARWFKAFSR